MIKIHIIIMIIFMLRTIYNSSKKRKLKNFSKQLMEMTEERRI